MSPMAEKVLVILGGAVAIMVCILALAVWST